MTTPTPLPLDEAAKSRYTLHGEDNDSVLDCDSGIIISTGHQEDAELLRDQLNHYEARVAELEQRERRFYAADGSFVEMESAEAVVAARIEAAKRVAELEGELARAKWDVAARNAHANALRDALVKARDLLCEDGDWLPGTSRAHECITAALIATPAASLAAYRKSVLEEAAKECEHGIPSGPTANEAEYGYNRGRAACASDIRAIAAHPANTGEVKP